MRGSGAQGVNREQQVSEAFVGLADTLADDFDPLTLFHRLVHHCTALLTDVDAAGVLMSDGRGALRVMGASTDEVELLELLQQQADSGPCVECYRTGRRVTSDDLAQDAGRWPTFVEPALEAGYRAVDAVPLRLHEQVVGAVNLFRTRTGPLSDDDAHLTQSLADIAALALLQWSHDPVRPGDVVTRLQSALSAKAALETAKGMIAQYAGVTVAEAAGLLRSYAEDSRARLTDTVAVLTSRTLHPARITEPHTAGAAGAAGHGGVSGSPAGDPLG